MSWSSDVKRGFLVLLASIALSGGVGYEIGHHDIEVTNQRTIACERQAKEQEHIEEKELELFISAYKTVAPIRTSALCDIVTPSNGGPAELSVLPDRSKALVEVRSEIQPKFISCPDKSDWTVNEKMMTRRRSFLADRAPVAKP